MVIDGTRGEVIDVVAGPEAGVKAKRDPSRCEP